MHIVDQLLENAAADLDLISKNRARGDTGSTPRDIDFAIHSDSADQADVVRSFITDNHYGNASVQEVRLDDGRTIWRVGVIIHAPPTEHVACSLSGLMVCIAHLFESEYVGWGCTLEAGGAGTRLTRHCTGRAGQ